MWTVGAALGVVALVAASAEAAALTASAGLGGAARPGRWTPVRVSVTNSEARLAGHLVVTWGDAVVRRRLVFDSPGTRQFELYLRSDDATDRVQVRLESALEPIEIAVPIRIVRDDERFELCVSDDATATASNPACTASEAAATLPLSPRGYEAVDLVSWPLGRRQLRPEQAAALRQFEMLKRVEQSGDLSLTPQPGRPSVNRGLPSTTGSTVLASAALYLTVLVLLARASTKRPHSMTWTALGFGAAVVAGLATSLAVGRVGPSRALRVHHQSVLQQIPGSNAALLSMRAVAEFPVRGTASLRLPVADGVIEASVPRGRAIEELDADGFPTLEGAFGLGARRAFGAEAVVTGPVLTVDANGSSVRITNRSEFALDRCRLASGLRGNPPEVLPPGGVIEAVRGAAGEEPVEVLGPAVQCETTQPAVALTEPQRPVIMRGTTVVAAYLAKPSAAEAVP